MVEEYLSLQFDEDERWWLLKVIAMVSLATDFEV